MNRRVLIIFLILVLSFIYSAIFINYYKSINNVNKSLNIKNDIMTIDKIYNFISETSLDKIEYLKFDFNDIKEINNQSKLNLAFYHLNKNLDFKKGVSSKLFEEYLTKVFGPNVTVKHETIKLTSNDNEIKYDNKNDIYISNKDIIEDEINVYNKLINFDYKNNKYYLEQYKFYINDNNVFKSYGDYVSNVDILMTVKNTDNLENEINKNISKFEKDLYIYTYVFSKKNGNIILEKYYKN